VNDLTKMATELHRARLLLEYQKKIVQDERLAWEQAHAGELAVLAETERAVRAADANLRAAALMEYQASGEKRPTEGVEVKLVTRLDYSEQQAFDWAKSSGMALALDKKAFEAIAKGAKLGFVRVEQRPQVTVATDLGKVLVTEPVLETERAPF
jgi:hypothetical protein